MAIDFTNRNLIWSSVIVETLQRLGLTTAVVCPGSRSAPLAIAVAKAQPLDAIPVLDERSAAFFALGLAKQSGRPVALICSSGTAAANFYPAVIEARESRVPLLVLTADRPPELRHCNAGQAIDQQKLYGDYPNWYTELALPEPKTNLLAYLRQTIIHAWHRTLSPVPGVVHLNVPFRDPLAPIAEAPPVDAQIKLLIAQLHPEEFFAAIDPPPFTPNPPLPTSYPLPSTPYPLPNAWLQCDRGVIIVGPVQAEQPRDYCAAIARIAKLLRYPVLAEALSPLRNYADLNPYLVATYDLLLRNRRLATALKPDVVIRFGDMPTSKELRAWLEVVQPRQWVVDVGDRNLDPLHGKTSHLPMTALQLALLLSSTSLPSVDIGLQNAGLQNAGLQDVGLQRTSLAEPTIVNLTTIPTIPTTITNSLSTALPTAIATAPTLSAPEDILTSSAHHHPSSYLEMWCREEKHVWQRIEQTFGAVDWLLEAKLAWILSHHLPPETPLFIANSTPVRDMEWFWQPGNLAVRPFFNRGANGIDGTLSTALGVAHHNRSTVLLTGDLALLHDTNGFLLRRHVVGHLTILLVNNDGGGIFEMLPISQFNPPFEEFFATPQSVNFAGLCSTYNIEYEQITDWQQLVQRLNPLPTTGIRILEVQTDRRADAQWRKQQLPNFANSAAPNLE